LVNLVIVGASLSLVDADLRSAEFFGLVISVNLFNRNLKGVNRNFFTLNFVPVV